MNNSPLSSQLPVLFAIVAIATLGAIALTTGVNGAIFTTVIIALAGLGGYNIRTSHHHDHK